MSSSNIKNDSTTVVESHNSMPISSLTNRGILIVLSSNYFGKTFIIDKSSMVIGRLDDCDIILDDPLVSKKHSVIIFDKDNKFYIEDLGSKNATFLNGKKLKKRSHIIYGDRIIVGKTIMRFYLEEKIEE